MQISNKVTAQQDQNKTISVDDESVKSVIKYSARDSIFKDVKTKQVHLYGQANVSMDGIQMNAGYICIDLEKNELQARYSYDKDSNKVDFPVFSEGNEIVQCFSLKYNTKTKKGFLQELSLKQEELYFRMDEAKKHQDDELHLLRGKLSTCDLIEPHYHFQLSRGVIVPDERIVTGPLNLHINGIPTPLGLPFALIPTKQKEHVKGLLIPEFVPLSAYGFGVQNLGYYMPINDFIQTTVYANLYNRGSWGLRNEFNYAKRYGFTGNLSLGFQQFRSGFPFNNNQNKFSFIWSHRQDVKASPFWNFSSNVNLISDNNSKNSLDPINPEYFSNSFNSDVNINRLFPGKPFSMGLKWSLRQNSLAKNIALISPILNANLTRVFPFKKITPFPKNELTKAIKRIGLTYNFEGQNRSSFADTLLSQGNFQKIGQQFLNGIWQSMSIQTSVGLFANTIKINPVLNYGNKINFQQTRKSYDFTSNSITSDTIQQAGMAHEMNMNVTATTIIYSYFEFAGKSKPKLRHLMTPSFGYRFVPKLNPLISDTIGVNSAVVNYSPYERSIYTVGNSVGASFLTFGFNNTLELKMKSEKDTITGFKKIRLIDQFSLTGNYDFLKDSMKLSMISLNLRISPKDWINFVSNASFSPYSWDSTGKNLSSFAWKNEQGIGRLLSGNFTTTLLLAPKKSRKIMDEKVESGTKEWNSAFTYFSLHPEQAIYFDIPWKVSFSHIYSLQANQAISSFNNKTFNQVQTLSCSGDVSFTKTWNLSGNININLMDQSITNAFFTLNRNLHCWALSFYWVPIGGNKSFLLSIRNISNLFKDAKFDFRKPPVFL
ncbi:MAG: LPS-assembly protein LptD [Bacteroidetes bacterium]|nr:LPS-assembly protein LptD [Bacteroidota bacterium]